MSVCVCAYVCVKRHGGESDLIGREHRGYHNKATTLQYPLL